jgi:hypothetical protein
LTHIYERIIDVMRALQRDELASQRNAQAAGQGHAADAPLPQQQRPVAGEAGSAPETGKKQ